MPRITIQYDSDSDFEKRHLELSTHTQILTHYESIKNNKKISKKEKEALLEHCMEKALLALKRAEDKLEKAKETIWDQKFEIEILESDAARKRAREENMVGKTSALQLSEVEGGEQEEEGEEDEWLL